MLQYFGIARGFDVDDQAERRNVDPACSNIGGDADPGTAIAQGLQGVVALVLAVLTRQRNRGKAAFDQRCVEMADIVARGAEQDCGFRFVETHQIDHGVFDIGGRDGNRLVIDITVARIVADGRNAQGFALITLGQRDDRARHRRRKQQGTAFARGRFENFLEIFAETHVEHFVGFIEHDIAQRREIERATFEVIAQAARCADDDLRAMV